MIHLKNNNSPYIAKRHLMSKPALIILLTLLTMMLGACASNSGSSLPGRVDAGNPASRILACKSTDRQVASQDQCLLDDAACYQIANGGWCTGERGNVCPAGSQALPAGTACPAGSRCIRFSESLECVIQR